MVINTNISAQRSAQLLAESSNRLSKSLSRLSSGSKITSPDDDAAGLAVSLRLDAQINRLSATGTNVSNAISFNQTRDGFLQKVGKALDRMSELAILAQDGTKTDADRALYQKEFEQIQDYIGSASGKDFNGVTLFSGASLEVAIDSEGTAFVMQGINLSGSPYAESLTSATNVSATGGAADALTAIKAAITRLSEDRATIGAYQTRLNYTLEQLTVGRENLMAASSRIQDANIAEESTEFAKQNILMQSGTAMLAQANQLPQSVLRLLQ